jgi:hypothetical protein
MNLPLNRNRWPSWATELFEERAGLMEFSGNMSRETAELRAEQDVRHQAAQMDREGREKVSA